MPTITDYISLVRLQQAIQVNYPKQDNLLSTFLLPYTEQQAIQFVLNQPFDYLSCKLLNSQYYWEFVRSANITTFEELQFVYVLANNINFELLKAKVPYYATWNSTIQIVYPTTNYLIDANADSWGSNYSLNVSPGFTHPFIPTFELTGRVCLLKSILLYEYTDTKGYYGPQGLIYLSPLRPINLNYPLGLPTTAQLTLDECYIESQIKYPVKGDTNWVGRYQGQYTNSTYNKHIKFWLYANDTGNFLLDQPPAFDKQGIALNALELVGYKPTLTIPTLDSIHNITINQTSTYKELTIA